MNKTRHVLAAGGLKIIICLFIVSCAIREEKKATLKSFKENKEKYYRIVELVKNGRYWYDGTVGVHRFGEDVGISFHSFRVNEDPFYLQFVPVGIYAMVYYIDTPEAYQEVVENWGGPPNKLEQNWYLFVGDWN